MNAVEQAPPLYEQSAIRRQKEERSGTIEHVSRDDAGRRDSPGAMSSRARHQGVEEGGAVPEKSWQQTTQHLHHLAARLERLQASLDVLDHQPSGGAPTSDRPATGGGSMGAMLMGLLLFVLGAAGGVWYRSAPPSEIPTVWQQLPSLPDRVVALASHPLPVPVEPVRGDTPVHTTQDIGEEPLLAPSHSDAKVVPAQAVEALAPVASPSSLTQASFDSVAPSEPQSKDAVVEESQSPPPPQTASNKPEVQPVVREEPRPSQTASATPAVEEQAEAPQDAEAPMPEALINRIAPSIPKRAIDTSAQAGAPATVTGYRLVRPIGTYVKI